MKLSKDLVSGLLFACIGLGSLTIASAYPFGSALSMGPGYFPMIVSGLIFLFGCATSIQAMRAQDTDLVGRLHLRPLAFIVASIVSFALLIDRAGLVIAVSALILLGWYANPYRNLRDLPFLLAIGITVPVLVFRFGLNMPIKLWML
ncbi:tripartite tricarboxylate transporter TctB family protein [Microvirga sp. 2MCAF38]|uniref:tripartite tricarboxylate transporter TctB family protein n=1 Tax=Microvirga sp. 2MCAF38 TaxID=3232989 RepID=UPI003F9D0B23